MEKKQEVTRTITMTWTGTRFPRDMIDSEMDMKCEKCGGIINQVSCTKKERQEFNCDPKKNYDCCCIAFTCGKCKDHFVMRVEAPDCW